MSDGTGAAVSQRTEDAALQDVLAALHAAVWGYGVVGDALPASARGPARSAEAANRDERDRVAELLDSRKATPVGAQAAYALPFPVLSAHDAAALAVQLEDGVARAWVRLLDRAAGEAGRQLAVDGLSATELRAVGWRQSAGQTPATTAFPGLPTS
jgi:Domain of unknown function (DUF4439)